MRQPFQTTSGSTSARWTTPFLRLLLDSHLWNHCARRYQAILGKCQWLWVSQHKARCIHVPQCTKERRLWGNCTAGMGQVLNWNKERVNRSLFQFRRLDLWGLRWVLQFYNNCVIIILSEGGNKMKQEITRMELHKPDKQINCIHVHAVVCNQDYTLLFTKKPTYKEVMGLLVDKIKKWKQGISPETIRPLRSKAAKLRHSCLSFRALLSVKISMVILDRDYPGTDTSHDQFCF